MDHVQQCYLDLQKAVHPDKFANASDQEKRVSMQQTSWINEAYNTLKLPVDRAIYLLKLKGVDINMETETTMDAAFLMQQMETREAMENASSSQDPLATLDEISVEIKSMTQLMMKEFSDAYNADQLDDARELVRKLQFMHKAKKEVNEVSATLEDELY